MASPSKHPSSIKPAREVADSAPSQPVEPAAIPAPSRARRARPFLWARSRIGALSNGPIDLRLVSRTLAHAALVGAVAGLVGTFFVFALEHAEMLLLGRLAGYRPLRAFGEHFDWPVAPFRPWLLWALPGVGALLGGLVIARFAPETRGGGGDAMIDAFHRRLGAVRPRVVPVKLLASVLTLGSGGSGGREGPTMHIGAAIGSVVGTYLRVDARERRVLLVAGCAAGISAVFHTPLGAALLAVEVLYRDDFESDALIPALLASVVSYSVFVSIHGESTLFAHAARYPFVPAHLPLYVLLAVLVSVFATGFLSLLGLVKRSSSRWRVPAWARPAVGGLGVGLIATLAVATLGSHVGPAGQGLGILGGGYGAAQVAVVGSKWLPSGWHGAELLLVMALVKMVTTSLTVGTGGSAGDFGPSLVMGGLLGGSFGRAAQLLLHDGRIDPGAFALVGMGTFYGGAAHAPVASLVLVCELAGSYDLLVPLMLSIGVSFVALRGRTLYAAQPASRRESLAHRDEVTLEVLYRRRVGELLVRGRDYVWFAPATLLREVLERAAENSWQDVFPVIDERGLVGVIDASVLRTATVALDAGDCTIAADLMDPPFSLTPEATLHDALELLAARGAREAPVLDAGGAIAGFLDEAEIARALLDAEHADDVTNAPSGSAASGAG